MTAVAPVPGAWYMSSRYGPPQNSDELPLQGISHPAKPSGAGPFPPAKELPQSLSSISLFLDGKWKGGTHSTRLHIPHQRTFGCSAHIQLGTEPPSLILPHRASRTRSREYGSLDPCTSFRVSKADGKYSAAGQRFHGWLTCSIQSGSNHLVLDHARVMRKNPGTNSICYYLRMLQRNCHCMPCYNPPLGMPWNCSRGHRRNLQNSRQLRLPV